MPRITKGMIRAANSELACIWELATEEGNANPACLQFHAHPASNYIATLVKAGQPLPEFTIRNLAFLKANSTKAVIWWIPIARNRMTARLRLQYRKIASATCSTMNSRLGLTNENR